jgi:hypothetical protein
MEAARCLVWTLQQCRRLSILLSKISTTSPTASILQSILGEVDSRQLGPKAAALARNVMASDMHCKLVFNRRNYAWYVSFQAMAKVPETLVTIT